MGTSNVLAAAAATTKSGGSSELLLLVVIFAVMIIFMFRSSSRRKRQAQDLQRQLAEGSSVRTTFGVFGTVTSISTEDNTVMLEVAPGVQMKILRQAVATVLSSPDEPDTLAPMDDLDADNAPVGAEAATAGADISGASFGADDRSDKIS
jgi:preprotein translocase subunit YajC